MDNKFIFDDVEDLVTYMFNKADDTDESVSVIANRDIVLQIMNDFLTNETVALEDCRIEYGYDHEYYLILDKDGLHWSISVHGAYSEEDKKYYGMDGYILFHEDVNSKSLVDIQNNELLTMSGHDWFIIGEDDSFESDDDEENNQEEPEDEEYSQYSGKDSNAEYTVTVKCNVDPCDVVGLVRYVERSVLHMYEMFDEMNMFRRLFGW